MGGRPAQRPESYKGPGGPVTSPGWTFQKIRGGGWVHSGEPLMPGHWAGRRGGRDERHLDGIWVHPLSTWDGGWE